jgi:hypothetical protein
VLPMGVASETVAWLRHEGAPQSTWEHTIVHEGASGRAVISDGVSIEPNARTTSLVTHRRHHRIVGHGCSPTSWEAPYGSIEVGARVGRATAEQGVVGAR